MAAPNNTEDEELKTLLTQIIKTTHNTAELFEIAFSKGDPPWEDLPGAAIGTKSIRDWKQICDSRRPQAWASTGSGLRHAQPSAGFQPTYNRPIRPAIAGVTRTPAIQSNPPATTPSGTGHPKRGPGRPSNADRAKRPAAPSANEQPQKRARQDSEHETTGRSTPKYPPPIDTHRDLTSATTLSSSGPESAPFYSTSASPSHLAPSAAPAYPTTQQSPHQPTYSPSQRVWSQSMTNSDREIDRPRSFADHSTQNRPATPNLQHPHYPGHPPSRQLPQPWTPQHATASFQAQVLAAPGVPLAPRPPQHPESRPARQETPQNPPKRETTKQ